MNTQIWECTSLMGMSFASCNFKSIVKLLVSGRMPSILGELGNFPQYLPNMITGLSNRRSGTREGYTCNEFHKDLELMGIHNKTNHL